jgi:hypothetical protein
MNGGHLIGSYEPWGGLRYLIPRVPHNLSFSLSLKDCRATSEDCWVTTWRMGSYDGRVLPHACALPPLRTVVFADKSLGALVLVFEFQVFVMGLTAQLLLKAPLLLLSQSLSPSNMVGEAEVGCSQVDRFALTFGCTMPTF